MNKENVKKSIKISEIGNKEKPNLINLRNILNEDIKIIDFEIKRSLKYNSDYVIIKTSEGKEYITFSKIIKKQLEEYKDILKEFSLICTVREKRGKSGIKYLCLE